MEMMLMEMSTFLNAVNAAVPEITVQMANTTVVVLPVVGFVALVIIGLVVVRVLANRKIIGYARIADDAVEALNLSGHEDHETAAEAVERIFGITSGLRRFGEKLRNERCALRRRWIADPRDIYLTQDLFTTQAMQIRTRPSAWLCIAIGRLLPPFSYL